MNGNGRDGGGRDNGRRDDNRGSGGGDQRRTQTAPERRGQEADELRDLDPGKFGLITKPTDDVEIARDVFVHAVRSGLNLLAPVSRIDAIPVNHVLTVRLLRIPCKFTEAEVKAKGNAYWYQTDGGKLALSRVSLDRLSQLAGLRDVPERCGRMDDGSQPFLWAYRHTIKIKDFSGFWREITRTKVVDYRDGSPEIMKLGDASKLAKAREHGAAVCESKASNRAVRAALGIPGSYSQEQAGQPFAVPVLVYVPPRDNVEVQRMIAAQELGLVKTFSPSQRRPVAPVIDAEETRGGEWRDDDTDDRGSDPSDDDGEPWDRR